MKVQFQFLGRKRVWTSFIVISLAAIAVHPLAADEPVAANLSEPTASGTIDGAEIFMREWIPGDRRSHGGDGLGPMFNDSSCVACHNQGGIGGGGPASKNVDIVTAFHNRGHHMQPHLQNSLSSTLPRQMFRSIFGNLDAPISNEQRQKDAQAEIARQQQQRKADRSELIKLHPGFAAAQSVVLHQNGTFAGYQAWRSRMADNFHFARNSSFAEPEFFKPDGEVAVSKRLQRGANDLQALKIQVQGRGQHSRSTQVGGFAIARSQRNTTALFGAGVIDAIPVKVLEELERKQAGIRGVDGASDNSEVSGRVARLKDGTAGRFGWKAQTPSLRDFVLTACAVELGLNVPGHPQAGVPQKPDYQPKQLDLNEDECNALIAYVADLPAPKQRSFADDTDAAYLAAGKRQFDTVGCAACHVENVGEAVGIFSDLLLHDLGPELGDTGDYGVFVPNSTPEGLEVPIPDLAHHGRTPAPQKKQIVGATRDEWRTPPLWGLRDSGPYLHDGRAKSIEEAIALHGGESAGAAQRFFQLSEKDRFRMVTFLKSLVAPPQIAASK